MDRFEELMSRLTEQSIPGGCDYCDSLQTVEAMAPGVYTLTVHHDDTCPVLRAVAARSN